MSQTAPAAPPPSPGQHGGHDGLSIALVLGAIGVVFGDIGTSPLYTLQECLHSAHGAEPTPENVFGVVSLIVWSVTVVVTIKYLAFLMRADNDGEGGIMALLALVPARITHAEPGKVGLVAALVIVGAALLFGDGIITPAISVLSALEGLEVATPTLKPFVVPGTVLILIGLFAIQKRGTGGLGRWFGPVMVVWFVTIGALGAAQIVARPEILGAISPLHGARFFSRNGLQSIRVLGGVVLAVTGGEALYADMGHFGRRPIRVGWLALIFPALLLCYLGQGAALLGDRSAAANPFFAIVPRAGIYPMVALASAATVIASQALISGVFSLTHQAMRLGYFPRVRVEHTSSEAAGQIYVPTLNWGLAAACIALVLEFRESARLAAAFGLAVSGTMAITSIIFYVVTRHAWGWSAAKAGALLVLFLSFDLPFVVANCLKFLDGGYVPFIVGAAFAIVMLSWKSGRGYLGDLMHREARGADAFLAGLGARVHMRLPGTAIVMAAQSTGIPPVLERLVQRFGVLHERVVIVTVLTEHVPFVTAAQRISVETVGEGIARAIVHYGFMEVPKIPAAVAEALDRLGFGPDGARALYILGRETVIVGSGGKMNGFTERMFAFLSRNARAVTDDFGIPVQQVIEVGSQVDL